MRAFCFLLITIVFSFASEIQIATYNVKNLFDGVNNGSEYSDFIIGKSEWSIERAGEKFELVKKQIKAINADIIALQEIENEEILKKLMRESGYSFFVFAKDEKAPVGLGVLSKIKPVGSQKFRVPNVKTRDILRVDFKFEDISFSLYALHFPARKNPFKQRIAAFLTLKAAIESGDKNSVIVGDFNTLLQDKASLILDLQDSKGLENLWQVVPKDERYSHVSAGAIDHILLSRSIFQNASGFKIWHDDRSVVSDHFALSFKLNSKANSINPGDISTLYENPILPMLIKNVVVIYKDRLGFVLNDGKRGIFVYEPKSDLKVGDSIDVVVTNLSNFKGNLEVGAYYILAHLNKQNESKFMINDISKANVGDVISSIDGRIQGKYLVGDFGKILVYDRYKTFKNNENVSLKAVMVRNFNGKMQLVINND